jgi:PIN domain nuclease of toxin-antitoxin system
MHHRDPFDRLIIAQSIEEGWPILTADPWFSRYPVDVIW